MSDPDFADRVDEMEFVYLTRIDEHIDRITEILTGDTKPKEGEFWPRWDAMRTNIEEALTPIIAEVAYNKACKKEEGFPDDDMPWGV